MSKLAWEVIKIDGLRFYHLPLSSQAGILFTTRRIEDEDMDHNLCLQEQLSKREWSKHLVIMKQTHSDKIIQVSHQGEVEADGCFTAKKNLALSVRVADCVPIFFWDSDFRMIGIVHAGWRGTLSKIALRFVENVENLLGISSGRLLYSLGPSIGKCCYRVGDDLLKAFRKSWPEADTLFTANTSGLYLDLRAANRSLLSPLGVKEVASLDICTHCQAKRFYSYRRERTKGRNWGVIVLHRVDNSKR